VTRFRWELLVAPSAERSLARLPEKVGGDLEDLRAARRGPYRVVYEVDEGAEEIRVLRIDHRTDVYRPR